MPQKIFNLKSVLLVICISAGLPLLAQAQSVVNETTQRDITGQTNPLKQPQGFFTPQARGSEIERQERKRTVMSGGPKFLVRKIALEGNIIVPSAQLLLQYLDAGRLEGRMLTFQDLQDFADKVSAYYQSHGYVNSYAYLPPQKIIDGIVVIKILEVRVGEINIVGNRWFSERMFRGALNLYPGDYFRMEAIEQALDKINAQPDRTAKAYLEPGQEPGTTNITLKVADRIPLHVSYEYNRRGSPLTGGPSRHVLHLTDNNLTGRGDIIDSALTAAEDRALFSEALHYELPVLEKDQVHVDFAVARTRLQKDLYKDHVVGKSFDFIPGYTHNLIDNGTLKLDWDLRFELKDSKTDVMGDKLSFDRTRAFVSGPRLTINDSGGRTMAGVDVHVGIPDWWGSSPLHDSLASRPDSGGSFLYESMNASRIQKLPFGMTFIALAQGQYSAHPLTALEQMYIGGMYSVRGYPENDSSGDSGFSLSQEIRIPLYFIPASWTVWGMPEKTWRNVFALAGFVDEGKVFDHLRQQPGSAKVRTLLGAGPGVRMYLTPDINMEFDLGYPFGDTPSDGHKVQPHLSVRAGF